MSLSDANYNTSIVCSVCTSSLQYQIQSLYDCKLVRVVICDVCLKKAWDNGFENGKAVAIKESDETK